VTPVEACGARAPKARIAGAPVGYLLKCFPRISETFILNEVLELERLGANLRVYSLNEPQEEVRHRLAAGVRSPIEYMPFPLLRSAHRYLGAHLGLLARFPLRYLATLASVLAAFDRDLFERFVQAGYLARSLRRDGVSHVHAGFVHYPGSVAWIVHRITGASFSLATHAKDFVHSPRELLRRKLTEAELVLTCTQNNVAELEAVAAPGRMLRLRRVYHGTDLERLRFEPCGQEDPPLILSVGRLVEKKGFDHLIAACAILRSRGRRFRCRIVAGSRDLWEPLSAQIRGLGLTDDVVLEGPLDHEDVVGWYRRATLMAMPCVVASDGDRDGIPNVLVEAAACGLPIVTTAVSGIPELVRDGETGLVVPERDPAALAQAIERLLDSPALRADLSRRARAHVDEFFDLRRNAKNIAGELARLAAPRSSRTAEQLEPLQRRVS
jgi:glycosyltransferase involved in cell wall biosynthesis